MKEQLPIPKAGYLREIMEERDGSLFGKVRPLRHFKNARAMRIWNAKFSGKQLGRVMRSDKPYRQVMIDGVRYLEHRVIAVLHGIEVAGCEIDHRDGNGLNNRIENLRVCSRAENMRNNSGWRRKTSRPGVHHSRDGKWKAFIRRNGKHVHLGTFETEDAAVRARIDAEKADYGEFSVSESRGAESP